MSDWPVTHITASHAAEKLRAAAFTNNEDGRTTVHSYLGEFIGADHDLDDALELVGKADEVAWVTHLMHHDLAVRVENRVYRYDVPRPERGKVEA